MKKLHLQLFVVALITVQQTSVFPACAAPQSAIKEPEAKKSESANSQASASNSSTKPVRQHLKRNYPRNDNDFLNRAIKSHVPAPGQFLKRRERIWETLKSNHAQKKDITEILRQYVRMNDSVTRGTNWVTDDSGNYTRMRPLSVQCKELEDALELSWKTLGK